MTLLEIMNMRLPEGNYTLVRPLGHKLTRMFLRVQGPGLEPILTDVEWLQRSDLSSDQWSIDGLGDGRITKIPKYWEVA